MKHTALIAYSVLSVVTGTSSAFADQCATFSSAFEKAEKVSNLSSLSRLYDEADKDAGICPGATFVYCLGRRTALAHLEKAYDLYESGASGAEVGALVDKALSYGAPWQVLNGKAELEMAKKTPKGYANAARHFQEALNDIAQTESSDVCRREAALLPTTGQTEKLHRQATIAMSFAEEFVEPPRDRAGKYGGVFLDSVRGFAPKVRPVPITFEYNKDVFTAKGENAANFLLDYLKREKLDDIILSGHTDERGGDKFNMALSKKRLGAVRAFLKNGGYEGKIKLLPKGEREPFVADDRGKYDEEQLYQLDRRVELRTGK